MSETTENGASYRLSATDHAPGLATIVNNATNQSVLATVGRTPVFADLDTAERVLAMLNHAATNDGDDAAIRAQNPDLETAWRTIAWWEQTCSYWRDEAHKGYALRDSLADAGGA